MTQVNWTRTAQQMLWLRINPESRTEHWLWTAKGADCPKTP